MAVLDQKPAALSDIALTVLKKRYLIKDDHGRVAETPETMFRRVADTIAQVDAQYGADAAQVGARSDQFYHLMTEGYFEPNSPTLMNAGRPLGQLSACFVLPIDDDLSSIYETLKHQALIHQSGGGTGFSFSRLRPRNDVVRSTMGVASGPVSFMDVYNHSTEAIKQGGTRRGANMGILRVDHPDILEFITVKQDLSKVTNFNISVAITDTFMQAVADDTTYDLTNPRTGEVYIASRDGVKHPLTGEVLVEKGQPCRLRARFVFDLIVQCAHATGEPGLFFIDQANKYNPVPALGSYESTNPCGEQPLLAYDVCNLGSINLGKFVNDTGAIDWEALREVVHQSTRFLDNVIDANHYPLPQIADLSQRIRRIGLGVMGWADMLIRMSVPYNSEEAVELGRRVMAFVDEESKVASEQIAAERGAFGEWERSIWGPDATCARNRNGDRIRPERRLRNCNVTTVAPTGTISIIAGCSSGIEPIFAIAFWRYQADARMLDINPDFVARAQHEGWYSEELMGRIADSGHIHYDEVPTAVQHAFVTAHDISPEWHVRMQGAFQQHTDSAISKTINFGYDATPEQVRAAYELAYSLGCKGITVYRDGSRANQVLSTGSTADPNAKKEPAPALQPEPAVATLKPAPQPVKPRHVPDGLPSHSYQVVTPLGKLRLFVTEHEHEPFEVFAIIGRAGSDVMAFTEAIGRLLSLALRCGIPVKLLAEQLRGIGGSRSAGFGPARVRSVPDAIGKILQDHYVNHHDGHLNGAASGYSNGTGNDNGHSEASVTSFAALAETTEPLKAGEICPDCQNATLMNEEGCRKCHSCGYAEC
ncbi:MAG TPA: vitamin B12-dependent ribonucleotide reductase [Kouleothrix sp.]|jgi:ribonucleoside-diphosphate reductase alpha chain|nr:vitamin B12-dependent ribonucleotide reductase [Kouleothrix sp.]